MRWVPLRTFFPAAWMTKSLRMLQAICGHLGLKAVDSELLELSKDTVVKNLAQDIRTNLKEETQR